MAAFPDSAAIAWAAFVANYANDHTLNSYVAVGANDHNVRRTGGAARA